jgi:hypothetical protein
MAEKTKRRPKRLTRAQIEEAREHCSHPLTAPRPWLKGTQRDPRLAAALARNIERTILTR